MTSPSCARPACPGRAAAWLAYDYEARCAWLDDQPLAEGDRSHRWPLCERHADNLRVPRGWFCMDRRSSRGGQRLDGQEAMLLPGSGDLRRPLAATQEAPGATAVPGARKGRTGGRTASAAGRSLGDGDDSGGGRLSAIL